MYNIPFSSRLSLCLACRVSSVPRWDTRLLYLFSKRFVSDVKLCDLVELSYKRIVPTSGCWGFSICQIVFPSIPKIRKSSSQKFCLSSLQQLAAHRLLRDAPWRSMLVTSRIRMRCTKKNILRTSKAFLMR